MFHIFIGIFLFFFIFVNFHNIETKKLLYARGQGMQWRLSVLVFLSSWGGNWVKSRFWRVFSFSLNVESTSASWKVDETILFVFCQIDELLLACNQLFSTFPIWFWDISDWYIFDDLVCTWWIVFIVMAVVPSGLYSEYLILIFLIFVEVFDLLGSFSTCLVFLKIGH